MAKHAQTQGLDPLKFALEHYQTVGYKEARRYALPATFDKEIYLLFNPDVKEASLLQDNPDAFVIEHFFTRRRAENRLYRFDLPKGFTAQGYLAKNPDLQEYAKSESEAEQDMKLKAHYTLHGQYEGRLF
ncbi:MAG: hypothetical protein LW864_00010 [Alphaproteobacteria bacterium]|nr:hypothetical protein [Alphaproteobacteria bacterium]